MTRLRLGLVAMLFTSACSTSVAYAPLHHPPRQLAQRAPATVEIFRSDAPPLPYVVVGTIETESESRSRPAALTPQLVAEMRSQAAHVGCDALVMRGSRTGLAPTGYGFAYQSTSYRADCVVFTGATASR